MVNVIIAPHPDDELIGCFEVIISGEDCAVVYTESVDETRFENAKVLSSIFENVKDQSFNHGLDVLKKYGIDDTYYFPDPHYELHPVHRMIGMHGEKLARMGYDVIFYNTNMNAPYIHEVKQLGKKQRILDMIYPDQKDMWEYEQKYFLFEGYNKWIFP